MAGMERGCVCMCGLRRLHDAGGILWQTELHAGGVVGTGRAVRAVSAQLAANMAGSAGGARW